MHMIDFTTNAPAIAYVGDVPWHSLGAVMQPGQSLEDWIQAARLNWTVSKRPLYTTDRDAFEANVIPVVDRVALVRDDSNDVLHLASDRYQVVQPREVVEFFADLTEKLGYQIETAGALMGGKRVWALAKTNQGLGLSDDDIMATYLLLATSYDGQLATSARFTSVRVVCNNTLEMSYATPSKRLVTVPHSTSFNAEEVHRKLGLIETQEAFAADVDRFASKTISRSQLIEFYLELMDQLQEGEEQVSLQDTSPTVRQLISCCVNGPGQNLSTTRGTLWGALNGVTYFTDHKRRARSSDTRLNSAWFGPSEQLKSRAYALAKEAA